MTMKWLLALSLGLALSASSAFAQDHTRPACSGRYDTVRTDAIKPGKLEEFLKAVRDHQAWYTARGRKDRIMVGRIVDRDHGGFSETTAYSFHIDDDPAELPHDASWNAFVAEYKDSSQITSEALICMAPAPEPDGAPAH